MGPVRLKKPVSLVPPPSCCSVPLSLSVSLTFSWSLKVVPPGVWVRPMVYGSLPLVPSVWVSCSPKPVAWLSSVIWSVSPKLSLPVMATWPLTGVLLTESSSVETPLVMPTVTALASVRLSCSVPLVGGAGPGIGLVVATGLIVRDCGVDGGRSAAVGDLDAVGRFGTREVQKQDVKAG
jgi:hypothetical protein